MTEFVNPKNTDGKFWPCKHLGGRGTSDTWCKYACPGGVFNPYETGCGWSGDMKTGIRSKRFGDEWQLDKDATDRYKDMAPANPELMKNVIRRFAK